MNENANHTVLGSSSRLFCCALFQRFKEAFVNIELPLFYFFVGRPRLNYISTLVSAIILDTIRLEPQAKVKYHTL